MKKRTTISTPIITVLSPRNWGGCMHLNTPENHFAVRRLISMAILSPHDTAKSKWDLNSHRSQPVLHAVGFVLRFMVGCVLIAALMAPRSCFGQPATPQTKPPVNKVDSQVGESGSFNDVMDRDRDRIGINKLNRINSLLSSSHATEAIGVIQDCFDNPQDRLLPRLDKRGVSLRSGASRILRDGGENLWKLYETVYGTEAAQLLKQADANASASGYHFVIRRFEYTTAGGQALDRLANWYFERHDYELAVACWKSLISNPVHSKQMTTLQRFKLVLAAGLCGQSQDFQNIAASSLSQKMTVGGQTGTFEEWRKRLNNNIGHDDRTEWRVFGGSPQRANLIQGTAPFLKAGFRLPLFDSESPGAKTARERDGLDEARGFLEQELTERRNAGLAFGFAGTPLVTDELIILRDALGLRVLDRRNKQTLWTYRTKSSFTVESTGFNDSETTNLRQSSFLQNSVLCQLSCDDRQIYLIDQISIPERAQALIQFEEQENALQPDKKPAHPPWNRLIALRISHAVPAKSDPMSVDGDGRVAWTLGGPPLDDSDSLLSGHFFLGPPLPIGQILYAVSEFHKNAQKRFYLTALQPENGHVLWSQTLADVPRPSRESPTPTDKMRLTTASFLSGDRGVLVCPLGAGVLVGINQITGEFLWTYDYRWRQVPKFARGFQPSLFHNTVEQALESDFPNPPLINQGRVYFLAPGDAAVATVDHIHCLDLETGKRLWQTQSRDAKYLVLSPSGQVLAVCGNFVQGISAENGSIQWTKRVPAISGIGVVVGENYLLPVSEGRVLCLNIKDGTEIGFSLPAAGIQVGNLVVQGSEVFSENGLELRVFPQAAERLAELTRRSELEQNQFGHLLELSEIYCQLGKLELARAELTRALQKAHSVDDRSTVMGVSRELAWHELSQLPNQRKQTLAEYAKACETPEQTAQYLMTKGEEEIRQGDWLAAKRTAREILDLNVDKSLRLLDDSDRMLTPAAWSAALTNRILREVPDQAGVLEEDPSVQQILETGSISQLRSFVSRYPTLPECAQVRLTLARKLRDDAQPQAAEFAVWNDYLGNDTAALDACQFLVELWGNAGLLDEAGRLLYRIGTTMANVRDSNGQSGHEFFVAYPRTSLVWQATQKFVPIDWDIKRVSISEQHEIDRQLRGKSPDVTFNNWLQTLSFPQSSHQLFIRGQVAPFFLRQINMETGAVVADFALPTGNRIFYPRQFLDVRQRLGHFLPSAGGTNCFGVSLLDRGIVWQQTMVHAALPNSTPWIGPASTDSCVFRAQSRLLAVNPSTGKLLWERNDLEDVPRPLNNLSSIPGDASVVLLVEPDEFKTYHLYNTLDGTLIREGTLKNCGYIHDHFGRNLLYDIPETPTEKRSIRLWDPLTDQTLFEYRATDNSKTILLSQLSNLIPPADGSGEFAIAEPSGRVRIIDGLTGKAKLDVELGRLSVRGAPALKSFFDGTRYYINIQNSPVGMGMATPYADSMFPTHQVTGDLYAIDPKTEEVIWVRKNLQTQNIVQLADYRLPFLVSLNRPGRAPYDRAGRQNRVSNGNGLRLEVIDGATGQTLGVHADAVNDRLFLMDYDRDAGRLRFRGGITQLQVNFGRAINRTEELDDGFVRK